MGYICIINEMVLLFFVQVSDDQMNNLFGLGIKKQINRIYTDEKKDNNNQYVGFVSRGRIYNNS